MKDKYYIILYKLYIRPYASNVTNHASPPNKQFHA